MKKIIMPAVVLVALLALLPSCGQTIAGMRKKAEQGNVKAQYKLGDAYLCGKGVPQDYVEAVKWFRKAAEQGDTTAQWNLGDTFYEGNGVPQNYSEAIKWYRKAAEQGDVAGQYRFGCSYYEGEGVPQDYVEAVKWFRAQSSRTRQFLGAMQSWRGLRKWQWRTKGFNRSR